MSNASTRPEHSASFPGLDRVDGLLFLLVFAGTAVVLMATMGVGVPRDESFYFHAAFQYIGWFEELWKNAEAGHILDSFRQVSVDRHFSYNREHPALMKMLFALSHKLFHEKLHWLPSIEALRVPAVGFASLLSGFTYLFARGLFGRAAGVVAVAFLLLQPRYFFHAHLACFDVAVISMWLLVVYGYWRSYDNPWWGVFTGIAWGVALSVKLNAFFLPVVLGGHWLWVAFRQTRRHEVDGKTRWELPGFPWVFVWMVLLGTLLFFALWPRHWFDTINRVQWYLGFHLHHVHYFVYYFGHNIQQPPLPISFPWVMTLLTIPGTILLAFVAGVLRYRARAGGGGGDQRWTGSLIAINIIFPIALISMPSTPIFGGVKHWMTAAPFIAIVAAGGVVICGRALGLALLERLPASSMALRAGGIALVVAATAAPALMASVENHPYGTSYYNEFIGSYRGAADAGMMRQFWGYSSRYALGWLNERAPHNARIWTHNTTGWAWQAYRRDGLVRDDLRPSRAESSQIGLYHHQRAFVFMLVNLWESYNTRTPVHVVDVDGVPVLSVYVRDPERLISPESDR